MNHQNHSPRKEVPNHVAIIMDGNGRWAQSKGEPRSAGHREGTEVARRMIEAAAHEGISVLTLYAFSSDNWKRPQTEVSTLMNLAEVFFRREAARCRADGIRLSVIGRRERLPLAVRAAVVAAEKLTKGGNRLHVRVALDYSSRAAIMEAALKWATKSRPDSSQWGFEQFSRLVADTDSEQNTSGEVDLLIRTGGEKRLSDFLLWESAYAELHFTSCLWPDFTVEDFRLALDDYAGRERRFGGVISSGGEKTA